MWDLKEVVEVDLLLTHRERDTCLKYFRVGNTPWKLSDQVHTQIKVSLLVQLPHKTMNNPPEWRE